MRASALLLLGVAFAFGCSSTPAGPDPGAVMAHVRLRPEGREVGKERSADGLLRTYFVVPKSVPDANPGFSILTKTFTADLNRHPPITGFSPYASYVGPHPDTAAATCHLTAWRKDGAPDSFALSSSAVTWDGATEIGIVVTASCSTS